MKDLTIKHLEDLTEVEQASLRALRVTERQEFLGKSFLESLKDWVEASEKSCLGLCFLNKGSPVGLVLFRRSQETIASIHGLKIALPWQGRGWGHASFDMAIAELKLVWPETKKLILTVHTENKPAIAVYRAKGMVSTQMSGGEELEMEMEL